MKRMVRNMSGRKKLNWPDSRDEYRQLQEQVNAATAGTKPAESALCTI